MSSVHIALSVVLSAAQRDGAHTCVAFCVCTKPMIVEKEDAFDIDDRDIVVAACLWDSATLRLELHSPNAQWTLVIGGAFSVTRNAADDGSTQSASSLSELVGKTVLLCRARKSDGELEMRFTQVGS